MNFSAIDYLEPISEDDHRFFIEFLCSDKVSESTMMIDEIEGFLTSICCGPTEALPSKWLSVIWGEEEPVFDTDEEASRIIVIILRIFNEIGSVLCTGKYIAPTFAVEKVDGKDLYFADDWCSGFLEGMKFWDSSWQDYFDDTLTRYLGPIVAAGMPQRDDELVNKGVDLDDFLGKLPEVLPGLVKGVYEHLTPCRKKMPPFPASSAKKKIKINRNDPCPCGSGRKYKKCCLTLTIH